MSVLLDNPEHLGQSAYEFQQEKTLGDAMPKLEVLGEIQRKSMLMWPCLEHDDTPLTPMAKP